MPGLNSQGTCENADVAIAESAAAAIKVLDKVVIASSSEIDLDARQSGVDQSEAEFPELRNAVAQSI
jgi:hypothetical protein